MSTEQKPLRLRHWIDKLRYADWDRHVEIVVESIQPGDHSLRIRLYSRTYRYTITAIERDNDPGYLGCIAFHRETGKGNDLADGPLNEKTWQKILADIVSYELVEPDPPPEKS